MHSVMKVQVGQKSQDDKITYHNMQATHTYTRYYTFLVKCTKSNKILKNCVGNWQNEHFLRQLPKCIII